MGVPVNVKFVDEPEQIVAVPVKLVTTGWVITEIVAVEFNGVLLAGDPTATLVKLYVAFANNADGSVHVFVPEAFN